MSESLVPSLPMLLVDDEESWLSSLSFTLEYAAGLNHVIKCYDSREVMEILDRQPVSVVLLDLTMPYLSGEELLARIVEEHPGIPVVILSGMNQIETAVRCVKLGAFDYFVKTLERERLIAGILRALSVVELQRENRELRDRFVQDGLRHPEVFARFTTASARMRTLFRYAEAVAASSEPILITGESGVGKELMARALHELGRPQGPWVAVNVAGLDDHIFSDTLFGHCRGAFTGAERERAGMIEKAEAGTLFLDEIGDLSPASQVKLLRYLQEGEYFPLGSDMPRRANVRVICATNHDLEARQVAGAFRKDLFYRLCAHRVHLPPLRERREDIPLLLEHFLQESARALRKRKPTCPQELPLLLATYHFPGNVRELRAMVIDAVSTHCAGKLSMASFRKAIGEGAGGLPIGQEAAPGDDTPFAELTRLPTLAEVPDLLVTEALRRSGGNQAIAAGLLGITRQALNKRLNSSK